MKFRNMFIKYEDEAGSDGGNAGGGGGADANQGGNADANANAPANANQQTENNSSNKDMDYANLWGDGGVQSNANEGQQSNANQGNQQTQQQQQTPGPSADERFTEHFKNLNIFQGLDYNTMMQSPENMQVGFEQAMQAVYKAAMTNSNQLFQERADGLKDEMLNSTYSAMDSQRVIGDMNTALPFTSNPAYKPIADAVLKQMLEIHGKTPTDAVKEVGNYFKAMHGEINSLLPNQSQNRTRGGFGTQHPPQGGNEEGQAEPDWVNFLSGNPKPN